MGIPYFLFGGNRVYLMAAAGEQTCDMRKEGNMAHKIRTTIQQIDARPGQRLLVVSDIHGHLDRFIQLLRQMHYSGEDILVIVGDLI